jgi:threonine aldolase
MLLIDLRSDTVTKPSKGMLDAMIAAQVGDDVMQEDPTVIQLEQLMARLTGKQDALFFPSGTMANQVALKLLSTPPGELICAKDSHVYRYEGGGIAFNSGLSVALIEGNRGRLTADDIAPAINSDDVHYPKTQLISLENPHNRGGGSVYDMENVKAIRKLAAVHGLKMHLDGARLFNAVSASSYSASEFCSFFDTVSVCLSKGLGAPVGSVLVSSSDNIRLARRLRKVMGGGMRQAGLLAAAGIYALEHNMKKLEKDHIKAKALEQALKGNEQVAEVIPVQTNIVVATMVDEIPVEEFIKKLRSEGVLTAKFGPQRIRVVTHLDVTDKMCETAIDILKNTRV